MKASINKGTVLLWTAFCLAGAAGIDEGRNMESVKRSERFVICKA